MGLIIISSVRLLESTHVQVCKMDDFASASSASAPASSLDEQEASGSSESTASLESSDGSEHQAVSLLSRLRAPTASDLARKRKVSINPPLGTKRSKGSSASAPKNISPAER